MKRRQGSSGRSPSHRDERAVCDVHDPPFVAERTPTCRFSRRVRGLAWDMARAYRASRYGASRGIESERGSRANLVTDRQHMLQCALEQRGRDSVPTGGGPSRDVLDRPRLAAHTRWTAGQRATTTLIASSRYRSGASSHATTLGRTAPGSSVPSPIASSSSGNSAAE